MTEAETVAGVEAYAALTGGPEGFRILLRDEDGDGQLPGRSRHAARRGNEQGHVVDDGPEALLNIAHCAKQCSAQQ